MNEVSKISRDIKTKMWMQRIHECKNSGMTARSWCEQNSISEQTYYKWLRRLKGIAIENSMIEVPTFVSVPMESIPVTKIIISKGDIRIELPDNLDEQAVFSIVKSLLC